MARAALVLLIGWLLTGCAVKAGGFSFSMLQNASVTLNTGEHDGARDPNAN